jgi:hypothetical protein
MKSRMKWDGHATCIREMLNTYKILIGKLESRRQLGISWCRQEDNIKMKLKEIWFEVVEWIHLIPLGSIKSREYQYLNQVSNYQLLTNCILCIKLKI